MPKYISFIQSLCDNIISSLHSEILLFFYYFFTLTLLFLQLCLRFFHSQKINLRTRRVVCLQVKTNKNKFSFKFFSVIFFFACLVTQFIHMTLILKQIQKLKKKNKINIIFWQIINKNTTNNNKVHA